MSGLKKIHNKLRNALDEDFNAADLKAILKAVSKLETIRADQREIINLGIAYTLISIQRTCNDESLVLRIKVLLKRWRKERQVATDITPASPNSGMELLSQEENYEVDFCGPPPTPGKFLEEYPELFATNFEMERKLQDSVQQEINFQFNDQVLDMPPQRQPLKTSSNQQAPKRHLYLPQTWLDNSVSMLSSSSVRERKVEVTQVKYLKKNLDGNKSSKTTTTIKLNEKSFNEAKKRVLSPAAEVTSQSVAKHTKATETLVKMKKSVKPSKKENQARGAPRSKGSVKKPSSEQRLRRVLNKIRKA
jgi:hypothetical protein